MFRTLISSILLFIIIHFIMVSCSPVQVFSDYDHSANFTKYQSYAWLHRSDSVHKYFYDNEIVERNVKGYVNAEMAKRGYKLDIKTPDILLEYHISSKMKTYTVSNPVMNNSMYGMNNMGMNNGMYGGNGMGMNNGMYGGNGYQTQYGGMNGMSGYNTMQPYGYNNTPYSMGTQQQQITYDEGTLLVDVIDLKANQLIWRGWSVGTLTDESDLESELPGDIRKIFKRYPIAPLPEAKK